MELSARAPHGSEPWGRGGRRPRGPPTGPWIFGVDRPRPASVRHDEAYQRLHLRRAACGKVTRIGMDASERFFQLHGVDASEQAAARRHLMRAQAPPFFERLPATVVAMEACGAAQHWAELTRLGHEVRLIAPQLAKPTWRAARTLRPMRRRCARRQAAAMRFAPAKTAYAQSPGAPQSQPFALHATLRCDTP